MHFNYKKLWIGLTAFLVMIGFDQLSKIIAGNALDGKAPIVIIDGVLELTYLRNPGAAWGMLAGSRVFFVVLTLIIMAVVLYAYVKTPWNKKYAPLLFTEILGMAGATGNFIDRCITGTVPDFIYFCLIDFPVFNIADCYVVIAAFLLVILCFFVYKDDSDFNFLKTGKNNNEKG